MQTFLPYSDFSKSAKCLDQLRLGKQRVEALQILKAIIVPTYGWKNHPAIKMWNGYINSLTSYGLACCEEWLERGYVDSVEGKIALLDTPDEPNRPWWLGLHCLHLSHQSQLLKKDFEHYSIYDFEAMNYDEIPYVWPQSEPGFVRWIGEMRTVEEVIEKLRK